MESARNRCTTYFPTAMVIKYVATGSVSLQRYVHQPVVVSTPRSFPFDATTSDSGTVIVKLTVALSSGKSWQGIQRRVIDTSGSVNATPIECVGSPVPYLESCFTYVLSPQRNPPQVSPGGMPG